jgi:hypothetical protein
MSTVAFIALDLPVLTISCGKQTCFYVKIAVCFVAFLEKNGSEESGVLSEIN